MIDKTTTLEKPGLPRSRRGGLCTATGERQSQATDSSVGKLRSALRKVLGSVSTWGFVDQGIVSVASFAGAAIVGNVCGSDELGVFYLAVRTFWLAAGIPNALVWMPYTARAPRLVGDRRRFFLGSATTHLLVIAAITCSVALLAGVAPLTGLTDKAWLLPMCLALVPFTLLMMLKEHLRRVLLAHMQTGALLKVDVPIALGQLAIFGLLAWTRQLTAITALLAMAGGCSWAVLWIAWHRKQFLVQRRRVELHWGYNFRLGRWLLVVSIAWLLGEASYYWLVESFHGLTVLGHFSAAAVTVMLFNPIMLTVQNLARSILANKLAGGGRSLLWAATIQGTRGIAAVFGVLFLMLALLGGRLVTLFFSDSFEGLDAIVGSLCLGLFCQVLCSPVEGALTALEDGHALLVASLWRLGMILGAGIPLIAWYGPVGVGFAMALGAVVACVYEWAVFAARSRHADSQ